MIRTYVTDTVTQEMQEEWTPDKALGVQIRSFREERGLTRDEFARLGGLGWSGPTVSKIEAGRRSVKGWELVVLRESDLRFEIADPWMVFEAHRHVVHTEAERRVCAQLGITVAELEKRSQRRWGMSFAGQRAYRLALRQEAGEASGRGAASRVTRDMTAELRPPRGRTR